MIAKLREKAKADLQIDRTDLAEESLKTPKIHAQWIFIHIDIKKKIRELQFKYDKMYRERWLYYNGKATADVYKEEPFDLKILKTDIKIFLDSDEKLREIQEKLEELKDALDLVERVVGELNRRSFHIKNAIDVIRWESGG